MPTSRAAKNTGAAGRKNVLTLFAVLAFAITAFVVLPGSASAFNISGFNYTNSSLQAAGHPATSLSFTRQGGESEDLRDVILDLPTGVFANPEAANPKCTTAQFNADACPASSNVGTVAMEIKAASLLALSVPGSIDVLTPEAGQVATLGITARPAKICILFVFCAVPDKVFLKTGITVRSFEDSGLRTYTPGAPRTTSIAIPPIVKSGLLTLDITVNKLTLSFQAKANSTVSGGVTGTGAYFWTQTGSCVVATSTAKIISTGNVESTGTKSFTPTGCPSVPFNPTFTYQPSNKRYQESSPVTFGLNIPDADAAIQNALPKIVDANFPDGSGINLNALAGVTSCSEADLKANTCPSSAIIGNATALSKYIPEGLTGPVYATGDVGNQVPIAVRLLGPRNTVVIFRGTLGVRSGGSGNGNAYARFDRIPQLPFKSFTLNMTKELYVNPPKCGVQTTTATITGFNGNPDGTVVTRTNPYTIDAASCPVKPVTTIDSGPVDPVSTNATPTWTFHSVPPATAFNCKIDAGAEVPCNSGTFTSQALSSGNHTFTVYGVNNGVKGDPVTDSFTLNLDTFTVTPRYITPSTTAGGAHPDIDANIDVSGGQPKSISLKFPAGLNASLAAVPTCDAATAPASCTSANLIGNGSITANVGTGGSQTGSGEIYLISAPTANDAGGAIVNFHLPLGDFVAKAGAYLVENGKNQYLEIRDFPTSINGVDITVTNLTVHLDGDNAFITNPSSCAADAWTSSGTSFSGNTAAAFSVPFTATNCSALPFEPTVGQQFTEPLIASGVSHDVATINLPAGNSTIRNVKVVEPPVFGPNSDAFGLAADMCPGSAADYNVPFNPTGCPNQSKVGTMTLNTPLLTTPLVGTVYLINKTPLPWFGVKFDQPGISVRLTGFTDLTKANPACNEATEPSGFCIKQITVLFQNVPDVTVSSVVFALNSAPRPRTGRPALPGELLLLADPGAESCTATSVATTTLDAWNGKTVTRTQPVNVGGC